MNDTPTTPNLHDDTPSPVAPVGAATGDTTATPDSTAHAAHTPPTVRPWIETQQGGVYIPPPDDDRVIAAFTQLHHVIVRLLGPDGCPWDVQQTHHDLRANLLEETYEVLEALDRSDMPALAEELGDLVMQVLVHSEMARQANAFDLAQVLQTVAEKLIRRHPHVFDDAHATDADAVLQSWEAIKAAERAAQPTPDAGILGGLPTSLPALALAQKMAGRAARVGFDWNSVQGVWAKIGEEVGELEAATRAQPAQPPDAHTIEEYGDLLFAIVQLGRHLDIEAESALRAACDKFRRRFTVVEQQVQAQQLDFASLDNEQWQALWNEAKHRTRDDAAPTADPSA